MAAKKKQKLLLEAQAAFLEIDPEVYLGCTASEREVAKNRFTRELRKRMSHKVDDVDQFVEEHMAKFPEKEADLEQLVKTNSAEIRAKQQKGKGKPKAPKATSSDAPYEEEDGVRVYHNQGDQPADEPDPLRRDGPTIGPITERFDPPVDLVGDRPPRTLTDLYARWPRLGEDSQFFLRIERMLPKTWEGIPVSGFVGEIRKKITEAEIQRVFGGREYKITLYGPDPRGRKDQMGDLLVKALTDPITLTVPLLPPVPIAMPEMNMSNPNAMNPLGALFGQSTPASAGDAKIHAANLNLFSGVLTNVREDAREREKESAKANTQLFSVMSEQQARQQESAERQAQLERERHEREVSELKTALKAAAEEKATIAAKVTEASNEGNQVLMRYLDKLGPTQEAEVRRLTEYFNAQLEILRRSHEDQMKSSRDRHEGDLRRADERLKDSESKYQQILEQERSQSRAALDQERQQWALRERDLRDQTKDQIENERNSAQQRIADMKERHEEALKQMERAHDRELRTIKEANEMKTSVSEQTHSMALMHAQERYEDAKEDAERAREEAAEAKDLPTILERANKQAELLGFEKKDEGPKGPWEMLAATAGAGIAQALGSANEWVPKALEMRQQARAQQPLPQQRVRRAPPQQQQQRQQPQQPVTRGAQWAAAGVKRPRPASSMELAGFQPPEQPPSQDQMTANPRIVETTAQATEPVVQESPPEVQQQQQQPTNGHVDVSDIPIPEKFLQVYPKEAMVQFLGQVEQAINTSTQPAGFAMLMLGSPELVPAAQRLVTEFTPEEVVDAVRNIPGAGSSPLLRRDGRKWLDGLWKALQAELAKRPTENIQQTSP